MIGKSESPERATEQGGSIALSVLVDLLQRSRGIVLATLARARGMIGKSESPERATEQGGSIALSVLVDLLQRSRGIVLATLALAPGYLLSRLRRSLCCFCISSTPRNSTVVLPVI